MKKHSIQLKIYQVVLLFCLLPYIGLAQPPGLTVSKGVGVQDVNGGIAVFGNPSGFHLAIDGDDIQAKNTNSTFARLDVNFYGGDIRMGGAANTFYLNRGTGRIGLGTDNPDGLLDLDFSNIGSIIGGTPGGSGPGWIYFSPDGDRWDSFAWIGGFSIGRNGTNNYFNFSDDGRLGIRTGNVNASSDLHVKQVTGNNYNTNGLRLEYGDNSNYWTTMIDVGNDYLLAYLGSWRAWVSEIDGAYSQSSDRKVKQGIQKLPKVLDRVMELNPVTYKYKAFAGAKRQSWGFIAQEVEPLFPDFVSEKGGIKGLAYDNFAVLSIKAIQELNVVIEQQKDEMAALKTKVRELQSQVEKILTQEEKKPIENSYSLSLNQEALLSQNQPNPFKQNTSVYFFIPNDTQSAQIRVTNSEGKLLDEVEIINKGAGQVNIKANTYPAGTYYYSLVLDGRIFETKKMVLHQ